MHTLLFLEPGHFHAALTLRTHTERVDTIIHVYAPEGLDLDAFVALMKSFNERSEAPTHWDLRVHAGENSLERLMEDRFGDIVILAGRNNSKLDATSTLHDAGFHTLVDKPWITTSAAIPQLDKVTASVPLAVDIMTSRYDVVPQLRHRIVATEAVFGEFAGTAEQPSFEITSLHHLGKIVNGAPLKRPTWYYDVDVQGDGMVDIQSHMVDQTQWLIDPEDTVDFDKDIVIDCAGRWETSIPLASYTESTGATSFPDMLAERIVDGELQLACNGQINYRFKGVTVRQRSEWALQQPEGGGDLHTAIVRGSDCNIVIRQGPETGYKTEVHATGGADLEARLAEALPDWRGQFPGLDFKQSDIGYEFLIPAVLRTGHEAHFGMVLDQFLDLVDAGEWPEALARRIRTRYTLTARAQEMATR
jgi:predicted dehydrogenase